MLFYQICTFKNPKKTKYEIRVTKINGNNDILDYKLLYMTDDAYRKFISQMRDNKYRLL